MPSGDTDEAAPIVSGDTDDSATGASDPAAKVAPIVSGDTEEGGPPATASQLEARELTDPRDMRALAHPTRLALLEMLGIHGPLTATQAGALIGESPSSCSFHLRTLARHHFVEETGDGRGRQRPWRLVNLGMSISRLHLDDQDTIVAAHALAQLFAERQLTRLRQWWGRRDRAAPAWVDATSQSESIAWLTPDELRRVNDAVRTAISGFESRLVDPAERPEGAELVELIYFSYPFGPGPTDGRAAGGSDDLAPGPTDGLVATEAHPEGKPAD